MSPLAQSAVVQTKTDRALIKNCRQPVCFHIFPTCFHNPLTAVFKPYEICITEEQCQAISLKRTHATGKTTEGYCHCSMDSRGDDCLWLNKKIWGASNSHMHTGSGLHPVMAGCVGKRGLWGEFLKLQAPLLEADKAGSSSYSRTTHFSDCQFRPRAAQAQSALEQTDRVYGVISSTGEVAVG